MARWMPPWRLPRQALGNRPIVPNQHLTIGGESRAVSCQVTHVTSLYSPWKPVELAESNAIGIDGYLDE